MIPAEMLIKILLSLETFAGVRAIRVWAENIPIIRMLLIAMSFQRSVSREALNTRMLQAVVAPLVNGFIVYPEVQYSAKLLEAGIRSEARGIDSTAEQVHMGKFGSKVDGRSST